jgi:hypothetical protein
VWGAFFIYGEPMKLKEVIKILEANLDQPLFILLPSGDFVPENFHVTEVGKVQKTFIDCGGTHREVTTCLLQTWATHDLDHRLQSTKLAKIIKMASKVLGSDDFETEVEYGEEVAAQYKLMDIEITPKGLLFVLQGKKTDCLAPDKCGINNCCNSGCC